MDNVPACPLERKLDAWTPSTVSTAALQTVRFICFTFEQESLHFLFKKKNTDSFLIKQSGYSVNSPIKTKHNFKNMLIMT